MLDPVGFWSYARQDDAHSDGQLSQLRAIVGRAIVLQCGVEVVVWQDVAAIPYGADWAETIERTLGQTTFFIPIVTPRFLKSENCRDEYLGFRRRMQTLGRNDLVFPVHYVGVEGMGRDETVFGDDLAALRRSQWIDFRPLFYSDMKSPEVRRWAGDLAGSVLKALRRPVTAASLEPAPTRAVSDPPTASSSGPVVGSSGPEPTAREPPKTPAVERLVSPPVSEAWQARPGETDALAWPTMPTSPPVGDERVGASRKVGLIAGLVALACIVAAGVGIFTMRGPSPSAPPATPVASAAPSPTPTPVASTPSPSPTPPARSGACDGSGVALAPLASRTPAVLSAAEECALKPKDVFRECADCPAMVVVPAGSFTMGSPGTGPQHDVRIAKPFAVGKIQVTVDEFSTFVSATNYDAGSACTIWNGKSWESTSGRSWRDPGFAQTGSHPATCLNWNDAQAYARWLAGRTSKNYRLPSEAEWEYAARGRTEPGAYPRYFFGDSEADFCEYGNGADETALKQIPGAKDWSSLPCVDGYAYTSPVGSFKPNAFGLYDMAGNVSQWLEDCDHENYDEAPSDGSAWITGSCRFRVLRGGSWNSGPAGLRPAARYAIPPSIRRSDTGFRLARTLNN